MIKTKPKRKAQAAVIGRALKIAADEMEMTITDVGSKMGVGPNQVSRYYAGIQNARADSLINFMRESPTFAKLLGFQRIADPDTDADRALLI